MSFWAIYKGRGEGCDYTIGCNMAFDRLKSTTLEAAKNEALENSGDDGGRDDRFESIIVLEVSEEHDLTSDMIAIRGRRMEERAEEERAAKRAQIAKLQAELENVR